MKKLLSSVAVMLMISAVVQAQDSTAKQFRKGGFHHKGMHQKGSMMMGSKLNMTEDQKTKMKSLHESFRKDMSELKKNDNITVKEWNAKREALVKKHHEAIQNILTPEQKAQIEKMKLERKSRGAEFEKNRMEKMKTELGLTNEQVDKFNSLNKATREKMNSIFENKALDKSQKHDQMKEVMKKNKEEMDKILTPEQKKKLEEKRKDKRKNVVL